ncbi:MAG: sulfate permease [Paraperlucidibaca sp.]
MRLIPGWLKHYRRADLRDDTLAGTITAILLVPQALAYALLAGLPPEVGLYASVLPPLIYALLGSSRTLAVGPVAVAAVMVASALQQFADGDSSRALAGALWLALLSGGFLLLFGLMRLGWLSYFVSHPVLSGFSTAAAITIIGTQIPALTGVAGDRQAAFFGFMVDIFPRLNSSSWIVAAATCATLGLLLAGRYRLSAWLTALGLSANLATLATRMMPLLIVVLALVLSAHFDGAKHVAVVGDIPQGLPPLSMGFLWLEGWTGLIGSALLIAIIGYVESLSVARILAIRRRERIDPDQELLALGATNIGASLCGGMPVAGGFSRSMVNFDAGARTQLAAIITSCWVALAAFALTDVLAPLPKLVLAAIVVVAVIQLIDFKSLLRTWRYDRRDGIAQLGTIMGVLLLGIEPGLLIGMALSIGLYLQRTSDPHIAVIGQVPGTEHYRNIHRHHVTTWPSLLLIRVDENIYFANAPAIESHLMNLLATATEAKHLILVLSGVANIDASGLEMLESMSHSLRDAGMTLHLAEVKGPVMDGLAKSALLEILSAAQVHLSTQAAVDSLTQEKSAIAYYLLDQ